MKPEMILPRRENILGTCPKCGGTVAVGKWGPFCKNRCGFKAGIALGGKKLTADEVERILKGETVTIPYVRVRNNRRQNITVRMKGVKEVTFRRGDTQETAYEYDFDVLGQEDV